jgi:outer membrane protein insertion porin family
LRGFLARGIGPRSVLIPGGFRSDALGGDAYWTAGLSAFTPIPGLARYDSLRAHFFVNAGSLVPLEGGAALAELPARIRQIFSSAPISSSVGAGILLRTSIYRLEVNVTTPVTMSASDQRSPVLQFGLGMEFL